MCYRSLIFSLLLVLPVVALDAQFIASIRAEWNDSFRSWIIEDEEENRIGSIRLKWDLANDFSEWTFELLDYTGEIKTKWRNDPNMWELKSDDQVLTARPTWPGDYRSWTLSGKGQSIILEHDRGYRWKIRSLDYTLNSYYLFDPRDWAVETTVEDLDPLLELFVIFLAIYHSTENR